MCTVKFEYIVNEVIKPLNKKFWTLTFMETLVCLNNEPVNYSM